MASLREARRRHAAHYAERLHEADALYLSSDDEDDAAAVAAFEQEWANIRSGQEWAAAHAAEDEEAADICLTYPGAGTYLLDLLQHPREHVGWLEAALTAARK